MEERLPIGIEGAGTEKRVSKRLVVGIIVVLILICVAVYFLAPREKPVEGYENILPVADFTYLPASPIINNPIQFTDKSSDEDGWITNWTWDFGDGNISYEQSPSHRYAIADTYTVNLTVTDNRSATASKIVELEVKDHYHSEERDTIQGSSQTPTNETSRTHSCTVYENARWLNISLSCDITSPAGRDSQLNLCLYYHNLTANTTYAYWDNSSAVVKTINLNAEQIASIGYGKWGVFLHHYNDSTIPTANTAQYTIIIHIDYQ